MVLRIVCAGGAIDRGQVTGGEALDRGAIDLSSGMSNTHRFVVRFRSTSVKRRRTVYFMFVPSVRCVL